MNYGFLRVAVSTPEIRVSDCKGNGEKIKDLIQNAYENKASVIVFPELAITGYTCGDLFFHDTLLKGAENALKDILVSTDELDIISIIGIPVSYKNSLYNCVAVCLKGEILAIVPKINIPNHNEFSEKRYFSSDKDLYVDYFNFAGKNTILTSNAVFNCLNIPEFIFGCEISEDLFVPNSPSVNLTQNGALVIFNSSATNEVVGRASYTENLIKAHSGKLCCAYALANAGFGESTTDLVFSGQNYVFEDASLIAKNKAFTTGTTFADIDLHRLNSERKKLSTYNSDKELYNEVTLVDFEINVQDFDINRKFPKLPFVPCDETQRDTRCEEILLMQASGLATRLKHTGIKNVVLGLSGGLDSTLALICCVHAFDMLGISRKNIHTLTMPCFGTTNRTKSNAEKLAEAYDVSFKKVNITKSVLQHFEDLNHDESIHDITYENSQARERTQLLMDISNKLSALVIGTGDLSELALGWATYNGDHMSMYAVNSSIPKTLVRYLTAYEASKSEGLLKEVLLDILDTPVSPELLPPDKDGKIAQITEDVVGPYELHDFFLYYFVRYGYSPSKIFHIAKTAFDGEYDSDTIKKWLLTFLRRFFTQQFKRSCVPDGVKVGTVSLSPRGDFIMPSDAMAKLWIEELENL